MHLGIFSYNVAYGARPDELARACEERGFESFWVGEHTRIPASRQTPYPGGDPLPRPYYHMADPFVSLMAAAAATTTIKLGTGVCLVVEHDPIVLAKTVATLDWLSHGRVLLGIGGGWNREEMEHHGTPFQRRWQVLRERVEAMKAIWTQEEASYAGEFVTFERIISNPSPCNNPIRRFCLAVRRPRGEPVSCATATAGYPLMSFWTTSPRLWPTSAAKR